MLKVPTRILLAGFKRWLEPQTLGGPNTFQHKISCTSNPKPAPSSARCPYTSRHREMQSGVGSRDPGALTCSRPLSRARPGSSGAETSTDKCFSKTPCSPSQLYYVSIKDSCADILGCGGMEGDDVVPTEGILVPVSSVRTEEATSPPLCLTDTASGPNCSLTSVSPL